MERRKDEDELYTAWKEGRMKMNSTLHARKERRIKMNSTLVNVE